MLCHMLLVVPSTHSAATARKSIGTQELVLVCVSVLVNIVLPRYHGWYLAHVATNTCGPTGLFSLETSNACLTRLRSRSMLAIRYVRPEDTSC